MSDSDCAKSDSLASMIKLQASDGSELPGAKQAREALLDCSFGVKDRRGFSPSVWELDEAEKLSAAGKDAANSFKNLEEQRDSISDEILKRALAGDKASVEKLGLQNKTITEKEENMGLISYAAAVGHSRLRVYGSYPADGWHIDDLLDQARSFLPKNEMTLELEGAKLQAARGGEINPETVKATALVQEAASQLSFFAEFSSEKKREAARDLLRQAIAQSREEADASAHWVSAGRGDILRALLKECETERT